ncbi:hypothetical protein SAMN04488540_10230 [Ferrimonas sediminum]|uniref:DUF2059 domain-containing protein n=1 Tax=Ferrimonas sediminum TaxID=718193 RepID=A0A1G8LDM0_9GAMM|nr:DUF2059 domain-containing protein [Ferrimonas sediminum]SDI53799.1 hypothetical protein SAMN04488540_10230 [Ferrimonas sediminum]
MKPIWLMAIVLMMTTMTARAADDARAEAERLLDSMGMARVLEQSIDQMLTLQVKQNPAMAPYQQVMSEFLHKHMSYTSLKPMLVDMYSEAFTAQELQDLNAFYQTPTGRKSIALMPQLSAQGAQLGAMKVQQNMAELQQMIQQEDARLKALAGDGEGHLH